MNEVTLSKANGKYLFSFAGTIDSNNADAVGVAIFSDYPLTGEVIFDFDKVKYISSAGLRVLLKAGKQNPALKIINVHTAVYEIFDMTGFIDILKIKRAMRVLSIEGKPLIGAGYNGKVYRYSADTIVKVFVHDDDLSEIEREILLAKKAFVLGVPTAIPFDTVKIKEGGNGCVFELLNSDCLNTLFINNPDKIEEYIQMYVKLVNDVVHTECRDDSLPDKKDRARKWMRYLREHKLFDEKTMDKLDKLVETIPNTDTLVHGDLHIKNIMMQNGEPLLIDMDTLGRGHPIFEFTALFLAYIGYQSTEPGNAMQFFGIPDELAERLFFETVNHVFADRSEKEKQEIIEKCTLLGYAWLVEKADIYHDPESRSIHAKAEVMKLIDKYDTLAF